MEKRRAQVALFFVLFCVLSLDLGSANKGPGGRIHIHSDYKLYKEFKGKTFFDQFTFYQHKDDSVEFVNRSVAEHLGLIKVFHDDSIYMGVEHNSVITPNTGQSRKSVEIHSVDTFNDGLFILDLSHVPAGCGTWPAFWLCGPTWPINGEIDILEGVNNQKSVRTTLHTGPHCTMQYEDPSLFTGSWTPGINGQNGTNCYVNASNQGYNQGCSISGNSDLSFGEAFNQIGGGMYATLWDTKKEIAMWFFPRGRIPKDATSLNPDPSGWGKPYAYFALTRAHCPSSNFVNQTIIFDNALCGGWAGGTFEQMCPGLGECIPYIDLHPEAVKEAYWLVNYLRIFKI